MSTLDLSPEIARVLDLEHTLENLGGDHELLREIMDFFVELMPQQIEDLAAAVLAGDVATVGLQAHGMKGGSGNVGAVRVVATARELEMLAKDGSLAGAAELVQQLREDFRELHEVLPRLDWTKLG